MMNPTPRNNTSVDDPLFRLANLLRPGSLGFGASASVDEEETEDGWPASSGATVVEPPLLLAPLKRPRV